MSNKTNRKNRTNQTPNWPSSNGYFTVNELFQANPEIIKITLRVKLKKAIDEAKSIAVIGSKKGSHGRPSLVYAMTPVSQEVINKARSEGIDIVGDTDLVKVLEITPVNEATATPVQVSAPAPDSVVVSH
jgi:type III secretion system FlhB-like substrate exporter